MLSILFSRSFDKRKKRDDLLQLITNFISYFPSSCSVWGEFFAVCAVEKLNFFLSRLPLTFKTFPSLAIFFSLSLSRIALFTRKSCRIHASGTKRNGIMIVRKEDFKSVLKSRLTVVQEDNNILVEWAGIGCYGKKRKELD